LEASIAILRRALRPGAFSANFNGGSELGKRVACEAARDQTGPPGRLGDLLRPAQPADPGPLHHRVEQRKRNLEDRAGFFVQQSSAI